MAHSWAERYHMYGPPQVTKTIVCLKVTLICYVIYLPCSGIGAWINEKEHYTFENNSCSPGYSCDGFKQVRYLAKCIFLYTLSIQLALYVRRGERSNINYM